MGVSEPVPVALLVAVILELIVEEPVPESDPVFEGLTPLVRLAVGVRVKDLDRLCVELAVNDGVGVPVGVVLAVGVIVADRELDALDVSETVGDTDGLKPCDGVDIGVNHMDALHVEVAEGVDVGVPVIVLVPLSVGVEDRELVVDGVSASEPEFDELAPSVTLEVGVCEIEFDILVVELGVIEGVGDDDDVILEVGEALDDIELVVDGVSASEPEFDELAPIAALEVGVCNIELDILDVELGVIEEAGDDDDVILEVCEALDDKELDGDIESVADGIALPMLASVVTGVCVCGSECACETVVLHVCSADDDELIDGASDAVAASGVDDPNDETTDVGLEDTDGLRESETKDDSDTLALAEALAQDVRLKTPLVVGALTLGREDVVKDGELE